MDMNVPHMTFTFTKDFKLPTWEEITLFLPQKQFKGCTPNLLQQALDKYLDFLDQEDVRRNGVLVSESVRSTIPPDDKLYNAMKKWYSLTECTFILGVNKTSPNRAWLECYCYPSDGSPSGFALKSEEHIENNTSRVSVQTLSPIN